MLSYVTTRFIMAGACCPIRTLQLVHPISTNCSRSRPKCPAMLWHMSKFIGLTVSSEVAPG